MAPIFKISDMSQNDVNIKICPDWWFFDMILPLLLKPQHKLLTATWIGCHTSTGSA
jgi:hypothetical protein